MNSHEMMVPRDQLSWDHVLEISHGKEIELGGVVDDRNSCTMNLDVRGGG